MFARGYVPGRSGQVFVVPREGDILTTDDPYDRFMHGTPWDYDARIPLLFYGPPFVCQGSWPSAAVQQDVAPTLGALIGAPPLPDATGRVLDEVLVPGSSRPRVAVLLVLDGMRADDLDRYAALMPTLTRMRREGAWFPDARTNVLPTVTAVGHANIGTGSEPRFHGIGANSTFDPGAAGKGVYDALGPRELQAPTLADVWHRAAGDEAVIIGQGGALRATDGLVGQGNDPVTSRPVFAASYDAATGRFATRDKVYGHSPALDVFDSRAFWASATGDPSGGAAFREKDFRSSSLYERFEGEALLAVLQHEGIGTHPATDLVVVNLKGPDYTAHAHGPDSSELRDTLRELDVQLAALLAQLDRTAGPGQSVFAITADHGMSPEPAPGRRHFDTQVVADLAGRLGVPKDGFHYVDAAACQIYVDTARLQSLGVTLQDVAKSLQSLDYIAAAFTDDEVRAAQAQLGPSREAATTPPSPENAPAFDWPVPEGWRQETIPFPLGFAPGLPFHGVEELRFAPGFSKPQSGTFWSYVFAWRLEDPPAFDASSISPVLREYFTGLALAVGQDKYPMDPERFRVELTAATGGTLVGQVDSYDPFVTGEPIVLNVEVRQRECSRAGQQAITFVLSPRPFGDPVWDELHACESALRCE